MKSSVRSQGRPLRCRLAPWSVAGEQEDALRLARARRRADGHWSVLRNAEVARGSTECSRRLEIDIHSSTIQGGRARMRAMVRRGLVWTAE
jgi:hypothetical protein